MISEHDKFSPIISVIVPIYNTASYLEDCISSVLQQTFNSFELILSDDGSTDGSLKICRQASEKDSRIKIIFSRKHRGISHARNQGMDEASGMYLFFLDSDDCIHPQLLEQMFKRAEQVQADITRVEYVTSAEMDEITWEKYCDRPYHPKWIVSFGDDNWDQWCKARGRDSVRQTLYNREAIGDLRFDEAVSIAEDALFNYKFMTAMPRKYTYSDTPGYYYRTREESITQNAPLERLLTWTGVKFKIRDQELSSGRSQYASVLEQENVSRMRTWIYNNSTNKKDVKIVQEKLKEERRQPLFRSLPFSQRSMAFFACYCLPLHNLLVAIHRKTIGKKKTN